MTDPVGEDEDPRVFARLEKQRRLLQQVVAVAALIPVAAGLYGVVFGPALTGERLGTSGDSHYRYLSGLHLAIGLLFWSTIPSIEATGPRFRLLTLVVAIGGLSRFFGMALAGLPSFYMLGALTMELIVWPALCLWQWWIARGYAIQQEKPVVLRRPLPALPAPAPAATPTGSRSGVVPEDLPEPVPPPAPPPPATATAAAGVVPAPDPVSPQAPDAARSST